MPDPINTPQPSPIPWWAVWLMAYTVLLSFIAAIFVCLLRSDTDNAKTLLIALISITIAATAFYWGSSSGSERKDTTIASTSAALATSAPVGQSPEDSQATADALNAAEALRNKVAAQ